MPKIILLTPLSQPLGCAACRTNVEILLILLFTATADPAQHWERAAGAGQQHGAVCDGQGAAHPEGHADMLAAGRLPAQARERDVPGRGERPCLCPLLLSLRCCSSILLTEAGRLLSGALAGSPFQLQTVIRNAICTCPLAGIMERFTAECLLTMSWRMW